MAYEAHTAFDKNGYVLGVDVTAGKVHDSVAFDDVYEEVTERFPEVNAVVVDSAYKTPHICKRVFEDGRVLSTAYKRPMTMKGRHPWWKYVYDEYFDCVFARRIGFCSTARPTARDTGSTGATRRSAETVRRGNFARTARTASKR